MTTEAPNSRFLTFFSVTLLHARFQGEKKIFLCLAFLLSPFSRLRRNDERGIRATAQANSGGLDAGHTFPPLYSRVTRRCTLLSGHQLTDSAPGKRSASRLVGEMPGDAGKKNATGVTARCVHRRCFIRHAGGVRRIPSFGHITSDYQRPTA